jgi:hypothetical protein
MGESEIVFLPATEYGSVIYPEGRSRASTVAAEVMLSHEEIPYGPPSAFKKGVYGRIVAKHNSPTKTGKPLLTVTTFPYSIKEKGVKGECTIFVVEADVVQAIEYQKQLETGEIVEVVKAKPKTQKELITEAAEAIYPGRYDWISPTELVIHFPEVEVRNGHSSHKIIDLFVRLHFSPNHTQLQGVPTGRRLTVTEPEIMCHYGHSHLHYGTWSWSVFCLGNTSLSMLVGEFRSETIDPDKFVVFLHWLGEYVAWESTDGGPYVRMSQITDQSRVLYRDTAEGFIPSSRHDDSVVTAIVSELINWLTPQDVIPVINPNGSIRWTLEPTRILKHQEMVGQLAGRYYRNYSFDKIAGCFINDGNGDSSSLEAGRRNFMGQGALTFRGKVIQPKVIGRTVEEKKRDIIQLPAPNMLQEVLEKTVIMLNRPVEAYYLHPEVNFNE